LAGGCGGVDAAVRNGCCDAVSAEGEGVGGEAEGAVRRREAEETVVAALRQGRPGQQGQQEEGLHRIKNKTMSNSQGRTGERGGRNLLSKAGQLTLANHSPHSLLQEVDDDEEFVPVSNITTSYLDQQGNSSLAATAQDLPLNSNYSSRQSLLHSKVKLKPSNDLEYSRITAQLRNNVKAHASSIQQQKKERLRNFMEGDGEELDSVEHIIADIQQIMGKGVDQGQKINFKPKSEIPSRSKKHNWQNKGVSSFGGKNDAFAKLEELLLNYKVDEKVGVLEEEEVRLLRGEVSDRRRRRQERTERNRKYQQVEKELVEATNIK
jgi:hypothetical protein